MHWQRQDWKSRRESGDSHDGLEVKDSWGGKNNYTWVKWSLQSRAEGNERKGKKDQNCFWITFACQPLFLCWTVFVASLVRRGSQMYVSYNLLSFFVKLSHWKTTTQWGFEIFFGFEIKIQKRTTKWTARWSFTNWTEYTCVPSTQIQK